MTRSTVPVTLAAEAVDVERKTVDMKIRRTATGVAIVLRSEED